MVIVMVVVMVVQVVQVAYRLIKVVRLCMLLAWAILILGGQCERKVKGSDNAAQDQVTTPSQAGTLWTQTGGGKEGVRFRLLWNADCLNSADCSALVASSGAALPSPGRFC